jgi:hypothetical protein
MRCDIKGAALAPLFVLGAAWAQTPPLDQETGLVVDQGFEIVKAYCTRCHSARLITQAGKTREGWVDSIRWMQSTQGLWDLGPAEPEILDYLSRHYGLPSAAMPSRPPVIPLPP